MKKKYICIKNRMSPEEEILEKIKFVLSCNNDTQAIRIIEQYGHFKEHKINPTHQWISVIDSLPEPNADVLVLKNNGKIVIM